MEDRDWTPETVGGHHRTDAVGSSPRSPRGGRVQVCNGRQQAGSRGGVQRRPPRTRIGWPAREPDVRRPRGISTPPYRLPGAKVHLVRRLPAKRRMGQHVIVLVDVERHESADGRDVVERVKIPPLVLRERLCSARTPSAGIRPFDSRKEPRPLGASGVEICIRANGAGSAVKGSHLTTARSWKAWAVRPSYLQLAAGSFWAGSSFCGGQCAEKATGVSGPPPASIIEFENLSSVNASTRRSTPVSINPSTAALTFSTPASAKTTGAVDEPTAFRVASSSTATLFSGANVSATRQARTVERSCRSPHGGRRGSRQGGGSPSCHVPHLVWPRCA